MSKIFLFLNTLTLTSFFEIFFSEADDMFFLFVSFLFTIGDSNRKFDASNLFVLFEFGVLVIMFEINFVGVKQTSPLFCLTISLFFKQAFCKHILCSILLCLTRETGFTFSSFSFKTLFWIFLLFLCTFRFDFFFSEKREIIGGWNYSEWMRLQFYCKVNKSIPFSGENESSLALNSYNPFFFFLETLWPDSELTDTNGCERCFQASGSRQVFATFLWFFHRRKNNRRKRIQSFWISMDGTFGI